MRGFTLIELTVVVLLVALGVSALVPAARRQGDRLAVISAREATVALVSRARREALLAGGAALHLRRDDGLVWLQGSEPARDTLDLPDRFGVRLDMSVREARLAFDALGIGRVASRSLAFARGDARAGVAVSAYGRVRRW